VLPAVPELRPPGGGTSKESAGLAVGFITRIH
jgi:hypothetical protein